MFRTITTRKDRDIDGYAVLSPAGRTESHSEDSAYVLAARMILTYHPDLPDDQRQRINSAVHRLNHAALRKICHQHGPAARVKVIAIARE